MHRYIPTDSTELKAEEVNAVAYLYEDRQEKPCAIGYSGKRSKPDFHYTYRTTEARLKSINDWRARLQASKEAKSERKHQQVQGSRDAAKIVKVGDIFVSSWGYDQTNVDFYQVIDKKGQFCTIREIGKRSTGDTGFMSDNCVAAPDSFVGDPIRKKIQGHTYEGKTSVYLSIASYANANLWDGEPKYRSWYH